MLRRVFFLWLLTTTTLWAQIAPRVGIVPMTEPVIGTVDGQRVLVYELTVTNYGNTAYNLTGLRL